MNNKVFHVISNTHWDREWRYPFQKNRQMLVDMIDSVLAILTKEPCYRAFHLDSQSVVLKDYLEIRPEKKELITALVKEKRLLIGPWYILPDEYQVGGENLIRNLLLGHKVSDEYGGVSKIGYSPFSWGQISQLPQIYKHFNIDLIMFYRGVNSLDSPKAEFLWEGADGTKMVTSRFSTMPRYNFYFYIYRPVIHNEGFYDVEYKWSKGGMAFHFADRQMHDEDYSIIEPAGTYYPENVKTSVEAIIKDQAEDFTTPHVIWMEGHDSSGPNIKTVRIIEDIKKQFPALDVRHSTLEEYAASVLKSVDLNNLKLVKGERRSAQFDRRSGNLYGYTTSARMYLKQKNFESEKWLQFYAEPFNAFSALMGRNINDRYLDVAWEYVIQNSAHDSIGGCSLDEIHEDMMNRYKQSIEISRGVFERAVKHITKNINSNLLLNKEAACNPDKQLFLTVFNPNNYCRSEVVESFIDIPEEFDSGDFKITGPDGSALDKVVLEKIKCRPVVEQLTDRPMYFEMIRYRTLIEVKDIPPFGFRQYLVLPDKQAKKLTPRLAEKNKAEKNNPGAVIENEFLRIKINKNGSLNITEKKSGVTYKNTCRFIDEGESGHAWTHVKAGAVIDTLKSAPEITQMENSSLRTVYSIKHRIKVPRDLNSRKAGNKSLIEMPVRLVVILRKNSKYAEFEIDVDNKAESHRLRIVFPTGLAAKYSCGEGQFDVVKRTARRPDTSKWIEQPMYDYPMHHFVDVTDRKNGCAVLVEGLKEYELMQDKANSIAVTLFRAFEYIIEPSSRQDYTFQKGAQCLGKNRYRLAFYPHSGDYVKGGVYQEALNFSNSLSLVQSGKAEGKLNPAGSFLEITPKELVFSALKKSENGKKGSFVLRLYNPTEQKISGRVKTLLSIRKAEEVTIEEKTVRPVAVDAGNSFPITLEKKKILTIRLTF